MYLYNKPTTLCLTGNLSENWRRFSQQFDIFITASGKKNEDDDVKIAMLPNFAGVDAI